ncbi:hypothetical protein Goshw_024925 [Gossypium schwendimanii]|uniref:Aminotransferase-like plant mobile domain-containing protein n=1 Tax=Gossypium schwendimanii TaxID=34291 RepID=A0A7J9MX39_GOSSC|nr:hypothetical protein [Gossypium schwendimanii]
MPDLSRNLVHLRWLLKLVDFRAVVELSWGSTVLETLYLEMYGATPPNKAKMEGCLSLLQSWVPLVNYAILKMHQTDRVLQQFRLRQPIPVTLEVLDDEHKIDLRQSNTNWPVFFLEYIKNWENQYDHIPTREPIIVLELACVLNYISWFRIHGKPYLLSEEQRCQKIYVERE